MLILDDRLMSARHLRIGTQDERSYIVARTRLAAPGRPYVVAECTPGALVSPPPGLETLTRDEMLRDPLLKIALLSWEDLDDGLARRERAARADLGKTARGRAMHPSAMPKTMRLSGPLTRHGSTA